MNKEILIFKCLFTKFNSHDDDVVVNKFAG